VRRIGPHLSPNPVSNHHRIWGRRSADPGWAGPGRMVRARTGLPPAVAAANGVRVRRSVLWVGRDRRRRGAAVLRWGRRHGSGSGGPVEGLTHSLLVSSVGWPDEATRCSLAVSSMAPVASPDLPLFPSAAKHRRHPRADSPIRQASIGSTISDIRNGGMHDVPYGQPSWIQS
jgi:hypothetical protein